MNYEKQTKKNSRIWPIPKVRNIVSVCLFIALFMLLDVSIGEVLNYYKYFHKADMHKLAWKDFYEHEKNTIDVLFVGSSHARFAFDTRAFNSSLGVKTFNLSSSGQTPVVGYYALKEALKTQKPRLVVYETYWRIFGTDNNVTPAYFVYDYIKGYDTKLELMAGVYGEKEFSDFLLQSLSKTYKHRSTFIPAVKNILHGQIVHSYSSSQVEYDYFTYYQDGFFGSDKVATEEKLFVTNPFKKASSNFQLNKKQLNYFKKTLDLCKKNNIEILMVTAPLPIPTMDFLKNYAQFNNEFKKIADSYGIEYLDYNLQNMNTRQFENDMFYDSNHLNMKGTKLIGKLLIPEVKEYIAN